jgi:hypothetical protein
MSALIKLLREIFLAIEEMERQTEADLQEALREAVREVQKEGK